MQTVYEERLAESRVSWLDRPVLSKIVLNWETILFATILILAVGSRFLDLGVRVQSHDENSHVYYSWRLYRGQGFSHDPLMHGPLQFHLIALSYFLFGDNDFTARLPHALASIATVAFLWSYRRYLGRAGALVAAFLMLISPYILYYGRYARNEAFVALFGVITLWAILRYLETGQARFMYWLTAATVLHFTSKETSFIYTAQALIFLAFFFIYRLSQNPWPHPEKRNNFLIALMVALLFLGAAGASFLLQSEGGVPSAAETAAPAIPGQDLTPLPASGVPALAVGLAILSGIALIAAAFFLIRGYTWPRIRAERSFDLLILLGTLVLPHLSAFLIRFAGWDIPTNASEVIALTNTNIIQIAVFLVPLVILSILIGLWWNRREWLINTAIFYGIFAVFYTTVFTNGAGFFTGIVGSLGYWVEQQGVNRGNQPWYYYALVQVPVYEYLPALGSLLAVGIAAFKNRWWGPPAGDPDLINGTPAAADERAPVVPLLAYWSISSLVAFSLAGEKMPWLTVHITLPMILLAGWGFGYLIDTTDWTAFRKRRGWLVLVLLPVFLISFMGAVGSLLGPNPPFQGRALEQLRATSTFITAFITTIASGLGLYYLVRPWPAAQFYRITGLFLFGFLGLLTARTAIQSSYINYDNANELLVYAHSAGGVKQALAQIEEISYRTSDGLAMPVAYDNETSYPYLWYLRNFSDARYYGADPTRSLRDVPAILVGDANYGKIEPVVGEAYYQFDYIRLWWPNQDYFNLNWERISNALFDPQMRAAVFQIWLNRDYSLYGQVTSKDFSLPNWSPSARMRLYIRKDIVGQLWNYGAAPSTEPILADPYEGKEANLVADQIIGGPGSEPGQFQRPRGIAAAADGSLYVADTDNHRIQHFAPDGSVLDVWGSFGDVTTGQVPGGVFNQPWGISVGPDGSVYVADTWNHRIQKFNPEGQLITMWGYFGQAEQPEALWGPRDVHVDSEGRVFVTDTGNKRVVVFDENGQFITQFGSAGLAPGQFDEPVGITMDAEGRVFVADTWNQRVQEFIQAEDGSFQPSNNWEVVAWFGQSLDNKPYLSVDDRGHIFVTDPEGNRVLQFTRSGEIVRYWGDFGTGPDKFALVGAVAVDPRGGVWVSDAGNSRLMHFSIPAP